MAEPIIAFHGKAETKEFFLARAKEHFAADQIVKGQYWEDGKGCAVGCLIHSSSHSQFLSASDAVRDPIQAVINLFIRQIAGDEPTRDEWRAADRAAYSAADRAALSNHYVWQSEILLSLLANAPVPVEAIS